MRIKLDEILPVALVDALGGSGHDVYTVACEGLKGVIDAVVWRAAQRAGRFLITQNLDFCRHPIICSRRPPRHIAGTTEETGTPGAVRAYL